MDIIGLGGSSGLVGMGVPFWALSFLPLVVLWSMFWKGLALWHSAQRGQQWWFVALIVINTVGILEIIYLFAILKLKFADLFTSRISPSTI